MKKVNTLGISVISLAIFYVGCNGPQSNNATSNNLPANERALAVENTMPDKDETLADGVVRFVRFTQTASTHGSYPTISASYQGSLLDKGIVLVGGGCDTSWIYSGSGNALPIVMSFPQMQDSTDKRYTKWVCKGADPPGFGTIGDAHATGIWLKPITKNGGVDLVQTVVIAEKKGDAPDPDSDVHLSTQQIKDGFVVVSGGCEASHLNGPLTAEAGGHAQPVVLSHPTEDNFGWYCKGAAPPDIALKGVVRAYIVAARLTGPAGATIPSLEAKIFKGSITGTMKYPVGFAESTEGYTLTGGGCDLSYPGHGSQWAEYMVGNSMFSENQWRCVGADPPTKGNDATAQAYAIGVRAVKR